ncbi:hypothetical protein GBA52_026825 [Prunus armeniaca]|nr:hypothetical protein GBA52_026825 [Prunus armeniaca]
MEDQPLLLRGTRPPSAKKQQLEEEDSANGFGWGRGWIIGCCDGIGLVELRDGEELFCEGGLLRGEVAVGKRVALGLGLGKRSGDAILGRGVAAMLAKKGDACFPLNSNLKTSCGSSPTLRLTAGILTS